MSLTLRLPTRKCTNFALGSTCTLPSVPGAPPLGRRRMARRGPARAGVGGRGARRRAGAEPTAAAEPAGACGRRGRIGALAEHVGAGDHAAEGDHQHADGFVSELHCVSPLIHRCGGAAQRPMRVTPLAGADPDFARAVRSPGHRRCLPAGLPCGRSSASSCRPSATRRGWCRTRRRRRYAGRWNRRCCRPGRRLVVRLVHCLPSKRATPPPQVPAHTHRRAVDVDRERRSSGCRWRVPSFIVARSWRERVPRPVLALNGELVAVGRAQAVLVGPAFPGLAVEHGHAALGAEPDAVLGVDAQAVDPLVDQLAHVGGELAGLGVDLVGAGPGADPQRAVLLAGEAVDPVVGQAVHREERLPLAVLVARHAAGIGAEPLVVLVVDAHREHVFVGQAFLAGEGVAVGLSVFRSTSCTPEEVPTHITLRLASTFSARTYTPWPTSKVSSTRQLPACGRAAGAGAGCCARAAAAPAASAIARARREIRSCHQLRVLR